MLGFETVLFQGLECHQQGFILLDLRFVTFFDLLVGGDQCSNFGFPVIAHSFERRIFPNNIVHLHGKFVNLHFEVIDIGSEFNEVLLRDFYFDFVLGFAFLFIVKHHRVFGLEGGHLVIEPHEAVLEVLKLEELTFEGGYHVVFMQGLAFFVTQLAL